LRLAAAIKNHGFAGFFAGILAKKGLAKPLGSSK
jgi:hypothetical protein